MKRTSWRFGAVGVAVSLALAGFLGAQPEEKAQKPAEFEVVDDARVGAPIAKGVLLVTLHEGVKEEELKPIFEKLEAKFEILERLPSMNHFVLATDHERLPELRQRLENHPYVAVAAFNRVVSVKREFNDPVFKKPKEKPEDRDNWNLHRIKAPEAWDVTMGGAVVAVIDSGAVLEHEDLVGRTTSPYSYATLGPTMQVGVKKIKDGARTYNEEVRNHGTHVAITIGGKADNGVGTVGIAPNSPIMPLQALTFRPLQNDDAGLIRGWGSDITKALTRALDSNVAVINMSIGGVDANLLQQWRTANAPDVKQDAGRKLLAQADEAAKGLAPWFDRANRNGTIMVVAAGNEGIPAEFGAYALSRRVVSVAATTREDKRAAFPNWGSNYGPYTTVSAPGADIWSGMAEPGTPYGFLGGTSMACPHVAGVVALMKTIDPELKLAEVIDILVKTGRPLQTDQPIGPLVNAKAAVEETRRRQAQRVPRQPDPPPMVVPPRQPPTLPTLPPDAIDILNQPEPWTDPNVQRIIQVWLSIALPPPPPGGNPNVRWFFNFNGQIVNVQNVFVVERPIWVQFSYRYLWENSLTLESTNMGSLYEFIAGTLRVGKFDPAPPRVPEKFRPRPNDPRPRVGGLPFDPSLRNTRWTGRNQKGETIDFDFTADTVKITRGKATVAYKFTINTYVTPNTIDLVPDAGGDPVLGLVQMVNLGEILVRTDFTNKRPPTIGRGDPLTFLLERTDVKIPNPRAGDDGVESTILHRGVETLAASYPLKDLPKGARQAPWTMPEGFEVNHYALSGDGKRVWLMLFNGHPAFKGDRWQLWSLTTDGADAKQATFKRHEKATGAATVVTNRDGSVAWIFAPKIEPFSDIHHVELLHVTPGGTAKRLLDTKDVKGVSRGWEPQLSADGRTLVFICMEGLFQVKDDGSHKFLVENKNIAFNGVHLVGTERLWNLSIDDTGDRWAVTAPFGFAKTPEKNAAVIGAGHTNRVVPEKEQLESVEMSDDGKTVLIHRGGRPKAHMLLWRDGLVKPIMPDFASVYSGVLSGDGKTMYAACNVYGTTATGMSGFLEDLSTGRRRAAMSLGLGCGIIKSGRSMQLNRDGSVLTSFSRGIFEFGPLSLYVYKDGAAPPADYPQIKSVRQRYDGGKLIVTAEVASEEPLFRVIATPLRYGYVNPAFMTPPESNPLASIHGLPAGHNLTPIPKRPGFYETVVDFGTKHGMLDDSYSLRIVAVNAGRNRATFQDVAVRK